MSVIDLATYAYNLELSDKGFSSGMKNAESQTDKFKSKMGGFSTFLKTSVVAGMAAVGVAAGAMIVNGVKATAQLDELMSQFKAATGSTAEETGKLKELTKELYKSNTDSYEEIVKTTEALKKSMGMSVSEIEKYQQSYMNYAKITKQANEDVVKAIDDIGDAWGLNAEETTKSLDILKKSNEEFGTDIQQVQTTMQQLAPSAKALGLSFDEANGFLNMFASSGIDAGQAVTAFTYAAKQVKSPEEFKRILSDIQGITDPTQRAQKAIDLFGARAGVAMSNVLDGTKSIDDFIVTMNEAAGTVTNASADFDNNFNVQWTLMKKQIGGLSQEIGEKFMPILNDILSWVNEHMPAIIGFFEGFIDTVGGMIEPIVNVVKEAISYFGLMNDETSQSFTEIKNNIMEVINSISEFIQSFATFIISFWKAHGDEIVAVLQTVWSLVSTVINTALTLIKDVFNIFSALFKGDWDGFWNGIGKLFKDVWEGIGKILSGLLDLIKTSWQESMKFLSEIDLFEIGEDIIKGLINGIGSMASALYNKVKDLAGGVIKSIKDKLDINSPSRITYQLGNYVSEGFAQGIQAKSNLVESATGSIASMVSTSMDDVLGYIDNTVSTISSKASDIQSSLNSITTSSRGSNSSNNSSTSSTIAEIAARNDVDMGVAADMQKKNEELGYEKYHDGGWVGSLKNRLFGRLQSDEVPAVLQTGEYVLSRNMIDKISNSSTSSNGALTNSTINIEKLINIEGNVDNSSMPKVEKVAKDSVKQLENMLRRSGVNTQIRGLSY